MKWRHPIDSDWFATRESLVVEEEEAALRQARDEAPTVELRRLVEKVLAERDRNRRRGRD